MLEGGGVVAKLGLDRSEITELPLCLNLKMREKASLIGVQRQRERFGKGLKRRRLIMGCTANPRTIKRLLVLKG